MAKTARVTPSGRFVAIRTLSIPSREIASKIAGEWRTSRADRATFAKTLVRDAKEGAERSFKKPAKAD